MSLRFPSLSDGNREQLCPMKTGSAVMLFVSRHIFTEEYQVFSLQAQNASRQDGADVQTANIRRSDSGLQRLVKKREVQLRRWIARTGAALKKSAAHFHRVSISRTSPFHRTDAMLTVSRNQQCTEQCKEIAECHRDQWYMNAHGKPANAMTQQAKSACLFLASPGDHFRGYVRNYPFSGVVLGPSLSISGQFLVAFRWCSGNLPGSFPIDFRSVRSPICYITSRD